MRQASVILASVFLFSISVFAETHESDLRMVEGVKYSNGAEEDDFGPVEAFAWSLPRAGTVPPKGYTELLPYVLRAPNQEEAGSCLYMSLTGIAEWWMAKLNPRVSRAPEGPLDLSERYLMNLAGLEESQNGMANWKTDSIYLFNQAMGRAALNRNYRFTKGWYRKAASGAYVPSAANVVGASYGTSFNWINQTNHADPRLFRNVPRFERDVIYADPESNQWNVGVLPGDIVERVKAAMVRRKAPVHVIYNHMGYWHAVYIVGFDDNADSKDCAFVRRFMVVSEKKVADLREQIARSRDQNEVSRLTRALQKAEDTSRKINGAFASGGGCRPKGMFYVRDSIYAEEKNPVYDYDKTRVGDEAPYSKAVVLHEYDWLKYLGNHVTQIYVVPGR